MMKKIITLISVIPLILFSEQSLSISRAEPANRLGLELDGSSLKIKQEYLTNYIMRLETKNGAGEPSILKRNTQILDFGNLDVKVKTEGFYFHVDLKGTGPHFQSETTPVDLSKSYINKNGDWQNSSIRITGGSLIDYIKHTASGLKNEDEDLAFVLNLLSLAENTIAIADKAIASGTQKKRIEKIKGVVNKIKGLKTYGESLSIYYTLSKVMLDSIAKNASALGGVDEKGEPLDANLASYYHKFHQVIEITDRLNTVSSLGAGFIKEKTTSEGSVKSLRDQFKNSLEQAKNKLSDTSSKTISKLYNEKSGSDDKYAVVSRYMIQPAQQVISEFKNVLAEKLKKAENDNELDKVNKLKKDLLVLTAGESFFQLTSLILDSNRVLELIKNDPKKAPEIIIPIFVDMSKAVSTMFLSEENLITDAQKIYGKLRGKSLDIITGSANVEKNVANKQIYYKAFLLGKDAANKFIPLVSDFILAPSSINTTIVDGKLNQFGKMQTASIIETLLSNGNVVLGKTSYINNESKKDVYYYVKPGRTVRISARLYRPKLFADNSPWMTNTNMVPGPIYSVRLSLNKTRAIRTIFCAKNIIGFRQYSNHLLLNEQALNVFSGVCNSGTLGISALNNKHWFEENNQLNFDNKKDYHAFWDNHFVTIYTEKQLGRKTDIKVPSYIKLQTIGGMEDKAVAVLGVKAEEAFGKTISFNISGLDMADKNWFIHILPKVEASDIHITGKNSTVIVDGLSKVGTQFNIDIPPLVYLERDPIETYSWNFGDGSNNLEYTADDTGVSAQHNFDRAGQYTVTLTIKTVSGQKVIVSQIIDVQHPPVEAPQNLKTTTKDGAFELTWDAVPNAALYNLYYSTNADFPEIGTVHEFRVQSPYILSGLIQGETYYLALTAEGIGGGESLFSEIVSATPTATATTVTKPLNDTGITWGGNYPDGDNSTCTGTTISAQDCSHGRDATHNDDSDGHAGFSFTKLDAEGHDLPASASSWSCVKDNVTGLIWEKKTNDGGIHDGNNTYLWGGVSALGRDHASKEGPYFDDWNTLVDDSNSHNFCGFNDWRVPNRHELRSIVDLGRVNPAIDTDYFPNATITTPLVWSSSPYAPSPYAYPPHGVYSTYNAWFVAFDYGYTYNAFRYYYGSVRLVRSGQ